MEIDESAMCVVIPFADGNRRDGVGDLLEIEGIRTERHRKNPIALFDHGKNVTLPIGKTESPTGAYTVRLDPVSKRATMQVYFYQGKGLEGIGQGQESNHALFCEQLFDLVARKFVRAGSIGYQVVHAKNLEADYTRGTPPGLHLLSVLMLEGSVVVLPANQDTTAKMLHGRSETAREILSMPSVRGKPLSPVLVKSLTPYATETKAMLNGADLKTKDMEDEEQEDKGIDVARTKALRKKYKSATPGIETRTDYDNPMSRGNVPPSSFIPGAGAKAEPSDKISPEKARQILKDNSAQGHPLTAKQRGMFGAAAGRDQKAIEGGLNPGEKVRNIYSGAVATVISCSGKWTKIRQDDGTEINVRTVNLNVVEGTKDFAPKEATFDKWKRGILKKVEQGIIDQATADRMLANPEKHREILHEGAKAFAGRRLQYRTTKGMARRLRKSVAGASMVYVGNKDLADMQQDAEGKGLAFRHLGPCTRCGKGIDKVRLEGDDKAIDAVAKRFGRPIQGMGGAKSLPLNTKMLSTDITPEGRLMGSVPSPRGSIDVRLDRDRVCLWHNGTVAWDGRINPARAVVWNGQPPEPAVAIAVTKLLKGAKSMKTRTKDMPDAQEQIDQAADFEEVQEGKGLEDEGGGEPEPTEKYSAQVLRRMHEDAQLLLDQYDEMRGPLENEEVDSHIEEKLQALVGELEEIEGLYEKHHPEAEPLAEKADEEEATSGAGEEDDVPAEEAAEAMDMKSLRDRYIKGLRKVYTKSASCPKCGKPMSECSCAKSLKGKKKDMPGGVEEINRATEFEEVQQGKALQPHEHAHVSDAQGFLKGMSTSHDWADEHRMEAYHHSKSLGGIGERLGKDFGFTPEGSEVDPHSEAHREEGHSPETDDPGRGTVHGGKDFAFTPKGSKKDPHSEAEREEKEKALASLKVRTKAGGAAVAGDHTESDPMDVAAGGHEISDDTADTTNKTKAMVWHKALGCASKFLHGASKAHDLSDQHRADAAGHADALGKALDAEQQMEGMDDEAEVNEPGEIGEKRLAALCKRQATAIKDLTGKLNNLASKLTG